jgi:hypothetical protein
MQQRSRTCADLIAHVVEAALGATGLLSQLRQRHHRRPRDVPELVEGGPV